jgi:predicted ATPase
MPPAPDRAPPAEVPHNLPAARTALIGRERECTAVARALAAAPLVTVTGVGGGGKTRLALAVAADLAPRYPDGAWFVELAAIAEPALLPEAVALALNLRPAGDADPVATLLAFLRPRTLLLVLDNCEHLVAACADIVARALAGAPGLRILATSREPLGLVGERQHRLAPLATPDSATLPPLGELAGIPAVRLFVARAQGVDHDFRLTPANAAIVAAICARLDGHPLALELAAARVGVLGLGEILERLNDSVRLLTGGDRVGPTRQRTLRATLAWGDALLSPQERALFHRAAVFVGGWDLGAAEAVCAGGEVREDAVLELLARLVNKSLVLAETGPRAARYRLLEPVRQFAAGLLAGREERDDARARHAAHYLALAERAAVALRGPEQVWWRERLAVELGNLRAALAWAAERGARGDAAPGLRLTTALVPFWEARGDLIEGRGRLATALVAPATGDAHPRLRSRSLAGAGRLAYLQGDYAGATAYCAEALALARDLDDPALVVAAANELGMTLHLRRDLAGSARYLDEALTLSRALGDRAGTALALLNLGANAGITGARAGATRLLAESLALFEREGDLRNIAIARSMLGLGAAQHGDHALAGEH